MRLSVLFFLPEHYQSNRWIRYSVPLFTAVSTIAIALVYSELSMFLGLVGASTGSIICYIVPALFSIRDAQIESDIKKQVSPQEKRWYSLILNHPTESTMILVGIVIGFVGTFCEFYAAFSPKDE